MVFTRHLEEDEEVLLLVHKHWLIGIKFLWIPTLAFILGLFLLSYFRFSNPVLILFYGAAAFCVFTIVWWLRNFFDYYLDAWIITDQGMIDVEWHGWFHRQSARVLFSDLQGVSYEINGVFATLLRYGEISVEKISTGSVISMEYVPRPRRVEAAILKSMEDYLHSKNLKDARHVQDVLSQVVAREMQLQDFEDEDDEDDEDDDE